MMLADKVVARLEREVERALRASGLTEGKRLVVAVSGGPDSLAMINALRNLRGELGLELHGAHLDHGLRGDSAEADARFVGETFKQLGVGLTSERADVPTFRKTHRLSLEDAARKVRHRFLARVAGEQGADAVALGHTADDQAESILMHIVRGAGLTGLRGMQPSDRHVIGEKEVSLVRPLLDLSRGDTAAYCRALNLEPRLDETNLSTDLIRNRVRKVLVPLLEEFNPAVRQALVRLSRTAAQQVSHLDSEVDDVWPKVARQENGLVALRRAAFGQLSPALQTHLLRRAVALVKTDVHDIEQGHLDDMTRLMGGPSGRSVDLPGGVRFSVRYSEAIVASASSDLCPLPPFSGEYPLKAPGETSVGGWKVEVKIEEPGGGVEAVSPTIVEPMLSGTDSFKTRFSYNAVGGRLTIRARRPGDRFQPLGMSGRKKLQDFMVNSKIPQECRDRVPLVVAPQGIAWVMGFRIADWARIRSTDDRVLRMSFVREKSAKAISRVPVGGLV